MSRRTRLFDASRPLGDFDVVFIVNSSGVKLVAEFNGYDANEYNEMLNFIQSCRHSNKVTLAIYPNI